MFLLSEELVNETCSNSQNSFYFGMTMSILLLVLILISVRNLEKSKCKCADIPEKIFLKEWFTFSLLFQAILIFFFILSEEPCYVRFANNYFIYPITLLFGIINFVMVIRLLIYIQKLRHGCPCGYGNLEKFIFWYFVSVFSIAAFFIVILLILSISTFFVFLNKNKKSK